MSDPCANCGAPLRPDGVCPWARDGECRAQRIDREVLYLARRKMIDEARRQKVLQEDEDAARS